MTDVGLTGDQGAKASPNIPIGAEEGDALGLSLGIVLIHVALCIALMVVCWTGRKHSLFWEASYIWPDIPLPFAVLRDACNEVVRWLWVWVPVAGAMIVVEGGVMYHLARNGRILAVQLLSVVLTILLIACLSLAVWSLGLPAAEATSSIVKQQKLGLPSPRNGDGGPHRRESPWGSGAFPVE